MFKSRFCTLFTDMASFSTVRSRSYYTKQMFCFCWQGNLSQFESKNIWIPRRNLCGKGNIPSPIHWLHRSIQNGKLSASCLPGLPDRYSEQILTAKWSFMFGETFEGKKSPYFLKKQISLYYIKSLKKKHWREDVPCTMVVLDHYSWWNLVVL